MEICDNCKARVSVVHRFGAQMLCNGCEFDAIMQNATTRAEFDARIIRAQYISDNETAEIIERDSQFEYTPRARDTKKKILRAPRE